MARPYYSGRDSAELARRIGRHVGGWRGNDLVDIQKDKQDMNSETSSKIAMAASMAGNAVQALRDALPSANAIQGDCILDLILDAAELKRKCARLADVIEQDFQ